MGEDFGGSDQGETLYFSGALGPGPQAGKSGPVFMAGQRQSTKVQSVQGLHLTADLHHCQCDSVWLTDAARLVAWCERAVVQAGLQPVAKLGHTFPPVNGQASGVTATILLAESHLCVHTWPEQQAVTLDVYVCNFGGDHSARAEALLQTLIDLFVPAHAERHSLKRGEVAALQASAS